MNFYDVVMNEEQCYATMKSGERSMLVDGFVRSRGNRNLEKFRRGLEFGYGGNGFNCENEYMLLMRDDGRPYAYTQDGC